MVQQPIQGDIASRSIAEPFSAFVFHNKNPSQLDQPHSDNQLHVLSTNTHTRLHTYPTLLRATCRRVHARSSRCYILVLLAVGY